MAPQALHDQNVFDFVVKDARGADYDLSKHRGQTLLIVNVASACGFTPQYEQLETLYRKFGGEGFSVLGFPCNQFGSQEKGSNEDIQSFCKMTYDVSFPVLAKVDVNGMKTDPLYDYLKNEAPGALRTKFVKWNFTKFLVGRDGHVIKRYSPDSKPLSFEQDIQQSLSRGATAART